MREDQPAPPPPAGLDRPGETRTLPSPRTLLAHAFFVQDWLGVRNLTPVFWSMAAMFQFYLAWAGAFWLVRRACLAAGVEDYHGRTERVMNGVTLAACVAS